MAQKELFEVVSKEKDGSVTVLSGNVPFPGKRWADAAARREQNRLDKAAKLQAKQYLQQAKEVLKKVPALKVRKVKQVLTKAPGYHRWNQES